MRMSTKSKRHDVKDKINSKAYQFNILIEKEDTIFKPVCINALREKREPAKKRIIDSEPSASKTQKILAGPERKTQNLTFLGQP